MNGLKSALRIFKTLIEQGEFKRSDNPDLYGEYLETDVQEALSIYEEELDCKLLNFDDTIYLVPHIDSEMMGLDANDLRSYFGVSATKKDVYLGYYIMMYILYEFYNGKNKDPKKTDFLQISLLIEDLDERFERLQDMNEEEVDALEEQYGINIRTAIDLWTPMVVDHETKRKTKYNIIKNVCKILEDNRLAYIVEEQIRTTKKLDILMRQYFLSADRVQLINDAFEKGEL